MTGLLVGAVIALVGVVALLAAATVWLAKRALTRSDQLGDARVDVEKERSSEDGLRRTIVDLGKATGKLEDQVRREIAARKTAEEQRDAAIINLGEHGDPDGVAAAINLDIQRLRSLVETPDLPEGSPTDSGGGPAPVHGEIESRDPGPAG